MAAARRSEIMKRASKRMSQVAAKMFSRASPAAFESEVVYMCGLSVTCLKEIREELLLGELAPGVELVVATADAAGGAFKRGETLQVLPGQPGKAALRNAFAITMVEVEPGSVAPKPRHEWDMEDINTYVVLPRTMRTTSIYAALQKDAAPRTVGQPFEGAFVVHPRSSAFCVLVEALAARHQPDEHDEAFYWLDTFGANQVLLNKRDGALSPRTREARAKLLKESLHESLANFEHRVVFVGSWAAPRFLGRFWCLWEMFGSLDRDSDVDAVYASNHVATLSSLLVDASDEAHAELERVGDLLALNARSAQCSNPDDLAHLYSAVQRDVEGSFDRFSAVLRARVAKWLIEDIQEAAKHSITHDVNRPREAKAKAYADLLVSASGLLERCSAEGAAQVISFLEEALGQYREIGDFAGQVTALRRIARMCLGEKRPEEAQDCLEEAISVGRRHFGEQDTRVGQLFQELAEVHVARKQHDEALEALENVVVILKATVGGNDARVANAIARMAAVLVEKGDGAAALKRLGAALQIWKLDGGDHRLSEAAALVACAKIEDSLGSSRDALKHAQTAAEIYRIVLGPRHESTKDCGLLVKSLMGR